MTGLPLKYIPTLDGWRCIAILLVVFSHANTWLGLGTTKLAALLHYPGVAIHIERAGQNGVNIFFCISGFLITRGLADSGVLLKSFYIRRAFRILPAAFVYLAFIAILGTLGVISVTSQEIFASLFFYRNYLIQHGWFTGHFWSLSVEEQYYMAWPSILAIAGLWRSQTIAAVGIVVLLVWRQLHWPLQDFERYHTDMRLDGILFGSLMALFWPSLSQKVKNLPAILLLVAAVGYFIVDRWNLELETFADSMQALIVCFLIANTVTVPTSIFSRLLEWSLVVWIGRMSYSIYLWQQLFFAGENGPHWQLPLRLLGIATLAWLSFEFIERPLIAVGRHFVRSEPRPA
jgi:peptidoglycan/LPS O-acetylase OafA/YrhL